MLLCDIGNTSYHFLDESSNNYKYNASSYNPSDEKQIVYYICVNPNVKTLLRNLDNWIDLSLHVDMKKYYETIGIDRVFACEAIDDGVIVDIGSAITVDIVEDGKYKGGFIYPGVKAMSNAYKNISSMLDYEFNFELQTKQFAKNSRDSISYGYLKPFVSEVLSIDKPIYLTGGDAHKFLVLFPNAKFDENIIFYGMKKVLQTVI